MSKEHQKVRKIVKAMSKGELSFSQALEEDVYYYELLLVMQHLYQETQDETYKKMYIEHCAYRDFNEGSYIIYGDTHFGSKSERKDYQDQVIKEAKKRNIQTIFHGGDIGDGMMDPSPEYNTYAAQIDHIIESLPEVDGLNYYMVIGNHDKKYLANGFNLCRILKQERSDIHILGKYLGYVNMMSHLVSIEHGRDTMSYHNYWYPEPQMRFVAHEHRMRLNRPLTCVPSLCQNDISEFKKIGKVYYPGYLVLNIEKEYNYDLFWIEGYQFTGDEVAKTQDKSFYVKKLK